MKYSSLQAIKFLIFDLDGVFYRGNSPIDGGAQMIEFLESNNIGYCFLTNNSYYPIEAYQKKLETCGVYVSLDRIITTTTLLSVYIKEKCYNDIFVLGCPYLKEKLYKSCNKSLCNPDALVIGMEDNMSLLDISNAINIIAPKTDIIAANPDKLIPKSDGFALECGVIIDIVEDVSKKEVFVVGKPSRYAYDFILNTFNISKEETLMVGDTYDTDIKGALNCGIKAAWVNTGNILPDSMTHTNFIRLDSLKCLVELLSNSMQNSK